MKTLERVPWINKEEWEYCRDRLLGNDLFLKKKALEHLYVWKVRCTNLPIAIECTLILMDVYLGGKKLDVELLSKTMIYESWCSMAIMRFLNLITDSNAGDRSTSSMNTLAKQIGIQEEIVKIRHTAAHGPSLLSLEELEKAVEDCLLWLYDSYWSKNVYEDVANENSLASSSTFQCFEACLLIKKYLLFGFRSILQLPVDDRKKISTALSRTVGDEVDVNLETLTLDKIHECARKKLVRHLKKDTKYGKDLIACILQTEKYLLSRDSLKNNGIDRQILNEWNDVLSVICSSCVCCHLLQELANVVISPLEESWRQHCAALYLKEILNNISQRKKLNLIIENCENNLQKAKKCKKNRRSKDNIVSNEVKIKDDDLQKILSTVLSKPNQFVKIFLKDLLDVFDSPSSSSKCEELLMLIDIYLGNQSSGIKLMETEIDGIHTLQQLQPKTHQKVIDEIEPEVDECTEDSMDVEPDGTEEWNWSSTPLGILPWQTEFQPWIDMYMSR